LAGDEMPVRCAVVIRGMRKPREVETSSRMDDADAAEFLLIARLPPSVVLFATVKLNGVKFEAGL
jgi:hypothetical protein